MWLLGCGLALAGEDAERKDWADGVVSQIEDQADEAERWLDAAQDAQDRAAIQCESPLVGQLDRLARRADESRDRYAAALDDDAVYAQGVEEQTLVGLSDQAAYAMGQVYACNGPSPGAGASLGTPWWLANPISRGRFELDAGVGTYLRAETDPLRRPDTVEQGRAAGLDARASLFVYAPVWFTMTAETRVAQWTEGADDRSGLQDGAVLATAGWSGARPAIWVEGGLSSAIRPEPLPLSPDLWREEEAHGAGTFLIDGYRVRLSLSGGYEVVDRSSQQAWSTTEVPTWAASLGRERRPWAQTRLSFAGDRLGLNAAWSRSTYDADIAPTANLLAFTGGFNLQGTGGLFTEYGAARWRDLGSGVTQWTWVGETRLDVPVRGVYVGLGHHRALEDAWTGTSAIRHGADATIEAQIASGWWVGLEGEWEDRHQRWPDTHTRAFGGLATVTWLRPASVWRLSAGWVDHSTLSGGVPEWGGPQVELQVRTGPSYLNDPTQRLNGG